MNFRPTDGTADEIEKSPTLEGANWHWQAAKHRHIMLELSDEELKAAREAWKIRDKAGK